jgi:DNA polymerase III epsilon subunit-like protein
MGVSRTNDPELLQLCVIDYFSGTILLDMLVRPHAALKHYNTRFSGITEEMVNRAVAEGEFLDGWEAARFALWNLIDANTVIVGHALNYDLFQLKIIHYNIVDSAVAVPRLRSSKHGLKFLANELTGKRIQTGSDMGHDCVEDALAARELVIWCSENQGALEERRVKAAEEARELKETRREKRE